MPLNLKNTLSKAETLNSKSVSYAASDSFEEDEEQISVSDSDDYNEDDEIYGLMPLSQTITI